MSTPFVVTISLSHWRNIAENIAEKFLWFMNGFRLNIGGIQRRSYPKSDGIMKPRRGDGYKLQTENFKRLQK
jgi:hypothetical protein